MTKLGYSWDNVWRNDVLDYCMYPFKNVTLCPSYAFEQAGIIVGHNFRWDSWGYF